MFVPDDGTGAIGDLWYQGLYGSFTHAIVINEEDRKHMGPKYLFRRVEITEQTR